MTTSWHNLSRDVDNRQVELTQLITECQRLGFVFRVVEGVWPSAFYRRCFHPGDVSPRPFPRSLYSYLGKNKSVLWFGVDIRKRSSSVYCYQYSGSFIDLNNRPNFFVCFWFCTMKLTSDVCMENLSLDVVATMRDSCLWHVGLQLSTGAA